MAKQKKATKQVFKNAPVYPDTKKQIDTFCKKHDLKIAKAMTRIVSLGIDAFEQKN